MFTAQVRNATPTNVISQFDYAYDAAGRRVFITKGGSAFGDLSGSVDAYTYNTSSELISARRTKNGQPIPGFSEDFDYDPIGNRRSSATYNEKGEAQTSTYQANNLNQYTSRTTPGYAAFGAVIAQKGGCAETNPWRFSSEYEDTDLGLDYYNYRHYEPVAGRWMSRDPLGGNRGIGLYCFVINKGDGSDILGLWPVFDSKYWTKKSDEEFESRHGSYSAVTVYSFVLGDRLDRGGSKKPWNSDEYAFFTVERLSGEQCKLAKKVNRRLEYYVDSKCPCKVCYRATANFPNVEVNVKFNREESWIKESMFKEENAEAFRILMGHESTHWVIACTFASRASEAMRKMFKKGDVFCNEGWAKRNAKDLLVTDIDAAFRKLESDDAEEQSKFDNETSQGTSLEKEQEWERRYEVK